MSAEPAGAGQSATFDDSRRRLAGVGVDRTQSDYSIYRQVVSQLMEGQEQLPSLPSITLEIRCALRADDVSLPGLVRLISRDPALSALLMKYASSALLRVRRPPKTLLDVLNVLGLEQVDRITMAHSVKSLFTLHSAGHKKLFLEAWERLVLKASTAAFLARVIGHVHPEHALLASLLSEVGTLGVLSAFKGEIDAPTRELYYGLCREYSKSLGVIMLKKWAVDEEYIEVIRNTGNWYERPSPDVQLVDLVNLSLYHAIKEINPQASLPPIQVLGAYLKLQPPLNFVSDNGELTLLVSHQAEIHAIAATLR